MADVTLSAAVRSSLLSLQNTTKLIEQTQNRLSSGLRVSGPVDDPVAFFQSKTLSDRARDFNEKKSGIDQGISTLTASLDAVEGIENIVQQLKGVALSAKSATTASQLSTLLTQFNDLRNQVNFLASDAQYQGLNLVEGTGTTLTVNLSTDTANILDVASVDLRVDPTGLAIRKAVAATSNASGLDFSFGSLTGQAIATGSTITITYAAAASLTFGSAGAYDFSYGTGTITINVGTVGITSASYLVGDTISAGVALTLSLSSAGSAAGFAQASGLTSAGATFTFNAITGQTVFGLNLAVEFNGLVTNLDSALTTLRSNAQKLGTNVALLQTRLEFTENYVNTLQTGADKLTLADLNEEGANLLALQTRQQLGISALSFAGQAEQSILALFR